MNRGTSLGATEALRDGWVRVLESMRAEARQRWQAAPAWLRMPAVIASSVAVIAICLLVALALVVQGVAERGAELNQAWAAEANQAPAQTRVSVVRVVATNSP